MLHLRRDRIMKRQISSTTTFRKGFQSCQKSSCRNTRSHQDEMWCQFESLLSYSRDVGITCSIYVRLSTVKSWRLQQNLIDTMIKWEKTWVATPKSEMNVNNSLTMTRRLRMLTFFFLVWEFYQNFWACASIRAKAQKAVDVISRKV